VLGSRSSREIVLLALAALAGAGGGALLLCLPGGVPALRLSAAAYIIFVWPGWALLAAIRPCPPLAPLERIAVAVAASAVPLTVEALGAYAVHPTMEVLLWGHLAVSLLLTIAAAMRAAGLRDSEKVPPAAGRGDWAVLAVALIFAAVLFRLAPAYGPDLREGIDSWYHLGYISYLAASPRVDPGCAFFAGAPPDPRYPYSASHLSLAAFAAAARLPILQVWAFLSPALSVAMLLAAYLFVRRVFDHPSLAAAAMMLLMAGMLMPESALIRSLSFKLSASPAVALRYPYPYAMATRVLLPTLLALIAWYLRERRRWILVLIGGLALSAPAFHVSQLLYLPLVSAALVLTAAVASPRALRASLKAAAAVLLALFPLALLISSSHAMNEAFADVSGGGVLLQPVLGGRLFVVAPAGMLFPWMLGAIALAAVGLLDRHSGASGLVAGAIVLLVPLTTLNPLAVPTLSRYVTASMLNRLYYPPPSPLYFAGFLLALAAIGGGILERGWERCRRRRSAGVCLAGLLSGAGIFSLAGLGGVRVFAQAAKGIHSRADGLLWPAVVVAVVVLLLLPLGRLARSRGWRLLPERPHGQAALLGIAVVICAALGVQVLAGEPAVSMRLRNDLTRWSVNPSTGAPRFLEAVAADAPAFTTVVYATDPFAAEITPAFGLQHVLFYDLNANPAVDTRTLARDWELLGDPEAPVSERQAVLERSRIGYVILTRASIDQAAAIASLVAGETPIYQDPTATVWRVE